MKFKIYGLQILILSALHLNEVFYHVFCVIILDIFIYLILKLILRVGVLRLKLCLLKGKELNV